MSRAERRDLAVQLGAHPLGYPMLRLLAARPVVRVPGIGMVVSDPDLLREVISDPTRFTKTGPGSPADLWTPVLGPSVLLNMEGAAHGELRRKLAPMFTQRAVTALADRVGRPVLDGMAARLATGRPIDLVDVAQQLTLAAVAELVGIESAPDRRALTVAVGDMQQVLRALRLRRSGITAGQVRRSRNILGALISPARTAFAAGGATVPGQMARLGLTAEEAVGAVGAFVLVGTETVGSFLPRLIALVDDADLWPWIGTVHDRIDAVIAEALRFTTPTPVMLRSVAVHTRIGAVAVRPGDRVVLATMSACRTQRRFDPRTDAASALRQLWFGGGSHFCLGMPLAMAQLRGVLSVLAETHREQHFTVVHRQVSRRVLIPSYRQLIIGSTIGNRTNRPLSDRAAA